MFLVDLKRSLPTPQSRNKSFGTACKMAERTTSGLSENQGAGKCTPQINSAQDAGALLGLIGLKAWHIAFHYTLCDK